MDVGSSEPNPGVARLTTDTAVVQSGTNGWLWTRSRFTKKWRRQWFKLDKNYLRYGTCETKLKGKISLDGSKIREASKDNKHFGFSIESGHRTYYFHAEDEPTRNKWMHDMCFAKFTFGSDGKSSFCTLS